MDSGQGADIHVYDLPRATLSRVTFDGGQKYRPTWSPDGQHLVYAAAGAGMPSDSAAMVWIRADGGGEPRRLLENLSIRVRPTAFSPDGGSLVYHEMGADIWRVPLDITDQDRPVAGKPEILIRRTGQETSHAEAAVSPDGRWISHRTSLPGAGPLFVRPFDATARGRWQITPDGAQYSFWSRDGRTLFYTTVDGRIMAVEYTVDGDTFVAGTPRLWSETRVRVTPPAFPPLDLAPDGKRFAILPYQTEEVGESSALVTFLLNFDEELRRRMAQP
jgi:Tol biopolymer transport system component